MDNCKLNNFFIPYSGSKMIAKKINNLSPKICRPPLENDSQTHNYSIIVRISYAYALNSNYRKLLSKLNVSSYGESDALSIIEKNLWKVKLRDQRAMLKRWGSRNHWANYEFLRLSIF